MRILAVSDLRVQGLDLLEQVAAQVVPDLILYAGDDVGRFGEGSNSWGPLAKRTPLGLAGVLGNDCRRQDAKALEQEGCHNLDRSPLILRGLAILGLGGAPSDKAQGLGSNLYTMGKALRQLGVQRRAAGRRAIILVSHTPPRGVLDAAVRFGIEEIGSVVVRDFIADKSVRAVVCGHVHNQGGRVTSLGHCSVINIASHDLPGSPLRYAVLEWDGHALRSTVSEAFEALSCLNGVGPVLSARLRAAGFRKNSDLLTGDGSELALVTGPQRARRIRAHARAVEGGHPVRIGACEPFPRDIVSVDVETALGGSDPWLVGLKQWGKPRIHQIEQLDATRHPAHLREVTRVIRGCAHKRFAQWSSFDRTALDTAHRNLGMPTPSWLQASRWFDACRWVRRGVALPVTGYGLKVVANYFGYKYTGSGLDGFQVGLWYSQFQFQRKPFDVEQVRSYNKDDLRALEYVVRAVTRILASKNVYVEPEVRKPRVARPARLLPRDVNRIVMRFAKSLQRRVDLGKLTPEARDRAVKNYRNAMLGRCSEAP